MIGSCTLVVKDKDGSYRAHIIGDIVLGDVKVAELMRLDKKYKKKPDASGLSESDVYTILSSHQCASKDEPHYSEFAGDRKWFVDLKSKSFIDIEEYVKKWESVHQAKIDEANKKRIADVLEKNTRNATNLRRDGKECLDKLTAVVLNPPEKQDVKYGVVVSETPRFYFGYSHVLHSIQFFTPKIEDQYFNTEEFFINYLRENGWKLIIFKRKDSYRVGPGICQIYAEKDGKTLCWDCDSHISITTVVEIDA